MHTFSFINVMHYDLKKNYFISMKYNKVELNKSWCKEEVLKKVVVMYGIVNNTML